MQQIIIIKTPGHSIGHQSLLVRTKNNGKIFLCADACNNYKVLNGEEAVESPYDHDQAQQTLKMIQ